MFTSLVQLLPRRSYRWSGLKRRFEPGSPWLLLTVSVQVSALEVKKGNQKQAADDSMEIGVDLEVRVGRYCSRCVNDNCLTVFVKTCENLSEACGARRLESVA